jgi:hypothetical protein
MIARLKAFWAAHGTKLLGLGGVALSTLALVDHETIHLIATTFGPAWGARIEGGFAIFGGIMTAYRGFENSNPK